MGRLQPWRLRKDVVMVLCRLIGWLMMVFGFASLFVAFTSGRWLRPAAIGALGMLVNRGSQIVADIERRLARWRATRT